MPQGKQAAHEFIVTKFCFRVVEKLQNTALIQRSKLKKTVNQGDLEIIVGDSPSGSAHAKIANRHGQWSKLEQRLDLSQDDIGVTLSCSFHVKVLKLTVE